MIYVFATTVDLAYEFDFKDTIKLSEEDLLKVGKYRNTDDKRRMITGRLLLLLALKELNIDLNIKNIFYSHYGRPFLGDTLDFNISHSRDVVVCALSQNEKVGIDIEACEEIAFKDFHSCFNACEWNSITRAPDNKTFYRFWTMKEASIKASGKGLSIPLTDVIIRDDDTVVIHPEVWNITRLKIHPNYICHLASKSKKPLIKITNLTFEGFIQKL
jgi:4'-phosphopantetheinyl transferase